MDANSYVRQYKKGILLRRNIVHKKQTDREFPACLFRINYDGRCVLCAYSAWMLGAVTAYNDNKTSRLRAATQSTNESGT
jgi:hypothetical protein